MDDFLSYDRQSELGIEPILAREWVSFAAFFARPYFCRVWILQEVTLAKRVTAICGDQFVDWEKIIAAALYLISTNWLVYMNKRNLAGPGKH